MEDGEDPQKARWPHDLRLVWSRPADASPPPPPRRPTNLALAIERHLSGTYGLSDEEFVHTFALTEGKGPTIVDGRVG